MARSLMGCRIKVVNQASVTAPGGTVVPGTAARAQIAAAGGATIVASLGPSVIVGEVDQARPVPGPRAADGRASAAAAPNMAPTYMGLRYLTANAGSPKATPLAYSIRCI